MTLFKYRKLSEAAFSVSAVRMVTNFVMRSVEMGLNTKMPAFCSVRSFNEAFKCCTSLLPEGYRFISRTLLVGLVFRKWEQNCSFFSAASISFFVCKHLHCPYRPNNFLEVPGKSPILSCKTFRGESLKY